jgi:hypothetical protein
MSTSTETTQAVVAHHIESALAMATAGVSMIPELLKDYAPGARVFTAQGVFEGEAGLTKFFEGMAPLMKELAPVIKLDKQEFVEGVGFVIWNAGDAVPMATDTFIVEDGKIVIQTFTAYMPGT